MEERRRGGGWKSNREKIERRREWREAGRTEEQRIEKREAESEGSTHRKEKGRREEEGKI